jgi:hypothetical protein
MGLNKLAFPKRQKIRVGKSFGGRQKGLSHPFSFVCLPLTCNYFGESFKGKYHSHPTHAHLYHVTVMIVKGSINVMSSSVYVLLASARFPLQ